MPTLSFSMASLSPFDSKDRVGEQKWYQKITVSYSLQASNEVDNILESDLFNGDALSKNLQTHISHTIPVSLSLNLLKYFQFSSSVNYQEHWYFQTIRKSYGRGSITGFDSLITDTVNGFRRAGAYNLSTGLSTKVYSTINFKKGNLEAIRHVLTPSVTFNYTPDFSSPNFGYYKTIVSNATIPYPYTSQMYSIFQDGFPGQGKSAGIGLNLDNTIEAKLKPKATDTSGKPRKVAILQELNIFNVLQFRSRFTQASAHFIFGPYCCIKSKSKCEFLWFIRPLYK